jgi:hypothetical protein
MKKLICLSFVALLFGCGDKNTSSDCFTAKSGTFDIAQQLRVEAKGMGWEVGKIKSTTVAGVIKTKQAIYPDSKLEICLKEIDSDLKFIMNSKAEDSGKAEWHFLSGSKNGSF